MGDNNNKQSNRISRRGYLRAIPAGGAALGLSGCLGIGGNGSGSNTGEVKFLSNNNSPEFKKLLRGFARNFEKENDATVDIEFTEIGGDYGQRVSQLLQAGNPPEIINLEQFRMGSYAVEGLLEPLDGVISEIEKVEEKIPAKFKFKYEGATRLVPAVASVTNNWYRQDVYNELNLDPPTTWESERRAAKRISEADNGMQGIGYATAATTYGSYHAWTRLWENNARVATRNGDQVQVALDQGKNRQRVKEVLEYTKEMVKYSPTATNWDWNGIYGAYTSGSAATALYSGGRPKTRSIKDDRPWADTTKRTSNPYNSSTRNESLGNASATGFGILSDASNTETAKDFVRFMTTGKQLVQYARGLSFHNVPIFKSWYDKGSKYRKGWDYLNNNFKEETIKAEKEAIFSDATQPFAYETDPVNPYASTVFSSFVLGQMFYDVVNGKSPDDAIDKAASSIRDDTEMK